MSSYKVLSPLCVFALLTAALLLCLASDVEAQSPVTNEPDADRGKALAERVCSNCHLVSDNQTEAVADVPTFREIANQQHQTPGEVMARIAIPAHPMPVIPLTKRELEDLAAYIMSLRSE
ncbi:MAG: cytochrome c [Methyloceanibacter sp.]|nr:cytochrome c [Methyloceanibacter sp.]